jgi:hypothetical protein
MLLAARGFVAEKNEGIETNDFVHNGTFLRESDRSLDSWYK